MSCYGVRYDIEAVPTVHFNIHDREASRSADRLQHIASFSCLRSPGSRAGEKQTGSNKPPYSGMLSCFFQGFSTRLVAQHVERAADAAARGARQDHLVDIAALGGDEGIGEALLVLVDALLDLLRVAQLGAIEDLDRALGPITAISAVGQA